MKLILAEPKFFVDSVNVISELVSEVRFKIDANKIELVAMDPANVAMVIFKLFGSAFTEYSIDKELEIAVNLENLKQILRRVKSSDILILELDEEKNRLKVSLKGDINRVFGVSLINIEEGEQIVPDLKFNAKIETSSFVFDNAIEDVGIVAESVALHALKNGFIIKSEGNITDAKVEINADEETVLSLKGNEITSKYSVDYLKKIIKGSKLSDSVVVQFGQDYPLRVDYSIIDKMSLSFILAPRVSGD